MSTVNVCNLYLESPSRSQDLLTIKWALRGMGYTIASTWHDEPASVMETHWNSTHLQALESCHALLVVCPRQEEIPSGLASFTGYALARGMQILWIGPSVPFLEGLSNVRFWENIESFRRALAGSMRTERHSSPLGLAA